MVKLKKKVVKLNNKRTDNKDSRVSISYPYTKEERKRLLVRGAPHSGDRLQTEP